MPLSLAILIAAVAVLLTVVFSVLTYALRDYSRARLHDALARRKLESWLEVTVQNAGDMAYLTASLRLFFNLTVLLIALDLVRDLGWRIWMEYLVGAGCAAVATLVASVILPHALAAHAGEPFIALLIKPLHLMRVIFKPLTKVLHAFESVIQRATRSDSVADTERAEEEIQSEIMAVVEEGEKTGLVDESEREMIESVIEFGDTTVNEVMTARPDIIGLPIDSSLERVRGLIEESGHSRIPVYEGSLDHIVGVLYARDLLKYVGEKPQQFEIRAAIRNPYFVPETKPLRDLLQDFRLQKIHIAIVLDEYGGTAGLVTIEDVLEELVGEISDEHEAIEPAVFKRIDDRTAEVDAKIHIDELNRLLGTQLPEEAGYDTIGGFVSTHLGRIPQSGTQFEHDGAKYDILIAEPQRVIRVKVTLDPPVTTPSI